MVDKGVPTDSLIIETLCDNFYDDIKKNLTLFDTSNYDANNIHGIPKTTSVIGKMKDEYKGHVISEFYGTGAKVCCIDVEGELYKKAEGVKHNVISCDLNRTDYQTAVSMPDTDDNKRNDHFSITIAYNLHRTKAKNCFIL
jgi:hypothetical protein